MGKAEWKGIEECAVASRHVSLIARPGFFVTRTCVALCRQGPTERGRRRVAARDGRAVLSLMARGKDAKLLNAAGATVSVAPKVLETQKQAGISDLESHCARLQALLSQVQLAFEYVSTENEQLRLALAPEIEPEPIRISVQLDHSGTTVELQLFPDDDPTRVTRNFCRAHSLQGERAHRVLVSVERSVNALRATSANTAAIRAAGSTAASTAQNGSGQPAPAALFISAVDTHDDSSEAPPFDASFDAAFPPSPAGTSSDIAATNRRWESSQWDTTLPAEDSVDVATSAPAPAATFAAAGFPPAPVEVAPAAEWNAFDDFGGAGAGENGFSDGFGDEGFADAFAQPRSPTSPNSHLPTRQASNPTPTDNGWAAFDGATDAFGGAFEAGFEAEEGGEESAHELTRWNSTPCPPTAHGL